MKYILISLLMGLGGAVQAQKFALSSPDKQTTVNLEVGKTIMYAVNQDGKQLVQPSAISFVTDRPATAGWKIKSRSLKTVNETLKPVVWVKSETVQNHYNQLVINFTNGISLEWRAFNDGVAWRWLSALKGSYKVVAEQAEFSFAPGTRSLFPKEDGFFSHNERAYKNYRVDSLNEKLASLPALFNVGGTKLVLSESDLWNYAGMWIKGGPDGRVNGVFPHHPAGKKISGDRTERVEKYDDFIAAVDGPKNFTWRVLMISRTDREILNNQLVYQLASPATGDFSWVKPGKVQWDWWHYNNIYGVDFRAGINNETYKYYIDFASKHQIPYVLLDEGWCDTRDLTKQAPGIDIAALAEYARSKNVDLHLWSSWLVLDRQLDQALDQFEKWGIKGIKVDFMQRDDQDMVNYYEKVARAAARRKLMVDFHGAYKPTGWIRTWPNVMTSEGVLGNEISKFAGNIDPDHTTTIPFIRMAAGPMDFTPGGMLNVQKNAFAPVPSEPMTLGTRCNQLAMYVIYESPLQMLCDIPTHYYKEPEAMEFLRAVPTTWKKTVALDARIGDYIAMARQAPDGDWYIGAMTDWTPRTLELDLSFLPAGDYKMLVWKDGINADQNAKDFKQEVIRVNRNSKIKMNMSKGGGYVARLVAEK